MDKLLYSKYSNERAEKFQICTQIYEDEAHQRYVVKRPCNEEAAEHVRSLRAHDAALTELYADTRIRLNHCSLQGDEARFSYLEGRTIEERLDACVEEKDYLGMLGIMQSYIGELTACAQLKPFVPTEEFYRVFGNYTLPAGLKAAPVTNIDMIFGNAIERDGDGWEMIDYEWTFDFPVPISFVVFRSLFFFLTKHSEESLHQMNLYEIFHIPLELVPVYIAMEHSFGRYVRGNMTSLSDMRDLINNRRTPVQSLEQWYQQTEQEKRAEIFFDRGQGYLASDSIYVMPVYMEDGTARLKLTIPEGVQAVRIDPVESSCLLHVGRVYMPGNGGERIPFEVNGVCMESGIYLHPAGDPQIIFKEFRTLPGKLEIEYAVHPLVNEELRGWVTSVSDKNRQLKEQVNVLQGQLEAERAVSLANRTAEGIWKGITWPVRKVVRLARENKLLREWRRLGKIARHQGIRAAGDARRIAELLEQYPHAMTRLGGLPEAEQEQIKREKIQNKTGEILFSILVPLYNTPVDLLREMIESVQMQTYHNWELCLGDGSDAEHGDVACVVREYAKKDKRIVYKKLEKNYGISGNTNECIKLAKGQYLALFDHDDFLHPYALMKNYEKIRETGADYLYTDELTFRQDLDCILNYHFKPDYAIDNLRANNYICHFSVFSRALLEQAGGCRSDYDGSQDHELILRLTEKANLVCHIPGIYYFWRAHEGSVAEDIGTKNYAVDAGKRAVHDSILRHGMDSVVESVWAGTSVYRIHYELQTQGKISIVIPNKDCVKELRCCIDSIQKKTTYPNYEIVIVDNGSTQEELFRYYAQLEQQEGIRILHWDHPFHYSAINNYGVSQAQGEYIVLLNNDTEVITPGWLQEMLMYAQREDVGAVGAKLLYEDDTIQHAGIVIGMGADRAAGHCFYRLNKQDIGYMGRLHYAQNVSAVTAACLMVKKSDYEKVHGLDEDFAVAYNDVDFCLKLRSIGLLNVFTPYAGLYHYESKTRGYEDTPEKQMRFQKEVRLFREKWQSVIDAGDPYFNPELDLYDSNFKPKSSYIPVVR
ncbi:MAG: glycosyltransferase family 2 protein [Lachnospiraceae bacterium]|nr:glycosyltransferase family 2 protein [Lachnospiraceae bacterium]